MRWVHLQMPKPRLDGQISRLIQSTEALMQFLPDAIPLRARETAVSSRAARGDRKLLEPTYPSHGVGQLDSR